jgi:hypothetical protein
MLVSTEECLERLQLTLLCLLPRTQHELTFSKTNETTHKQRICTNNPCTTWLLLDLKPVKTNKLKPDAFLPNRFVQGLLVRILFYVQTSRYDIETTQL